MHMLPIEVCNNGEIIEYHLKKKLTGMKIVENWLQSQNNTTHRLGESKEFNKLLCSLYSKQIILCSFLFCARLLSPLLLLWDDGASRRNGLSAPVSLSSRLCVPRVPSLPFPRIPW